MASRDTNPFRVTRTRLLLIALFLTGGYGGLSMSTVFAMAHPESEAAGEAVEKVIHAYEILGSAGFVVVFFLFLLAYCIYTWTQNEKQRVVAEAQATVARANAEAKAIESKGQREAQHELWLQTKLTELIEMGHTRMAENTAAFNEFREDLKDLRETIRAR